MSANDEISKKLSERFPREAIKQRQGGGGKMLSYLDGATVIRRINEATGNCWDFVVLAEGREGNMLTALVRLTIPGLGSREHKGVQIVQPNGGEDIHKGAITDALKKAATLFGVGLETYSDDYGSDEAQSPAPRQTTQQRPPQRAQQAPQPFSADEFIAMIDAAWAMRRGGDDYPPIVAYFQANRARMTNDQFADSKEHLRNIKAWTPEGATAP